MSKFNIFVIGNGGREHAIVNKLLLSSSVDKIYISNGGNGGTQSINSSSVTVENVSIGSSKADFPELLKFSIENNVRLVIPGPEQPLIEGIKDFFQNHNNSGTQISVFGPSAAAAVMEGSKTYSKDFMKRHNIPTAAYENFSDYDSALRFIKSSYASNPKIRLVLKASGIAAGKGVLIPETEAECISALDDLMKFKKFGSAGDEIVIEQFLDGDEISILTICDGYSFINLPPSQDHKKIGENDTGLNTGGMGSYAPTPLCTPNLLDQISETIVKPTIDGLRKEGHPFVGVLFTGIILDKATGKPQVLEYNVRFGDPETQSVLQLIDYSKTDLAQVFLSAADGHLDSTPCIIDQSKYAATVVLASHGYPESYKKGEIINISDVSDSNIDIIHSGTKVTSNGDVVTNGGRVIGVSSVSKVDLKSCVANAYHAIEKIHFNGMYFRKDIAHRAFRDTPSTCGITYADSGVSVDNGNLLVENIKSLVKSTARSGADSQIGGFGGLFDLEKAGYTSDFLLVAATDGVGTKLKIAQDSKKHDTVGIDLVAMNVNDLIVQGAEPLFFLDYFATGKLNVKIAHDFVSGVVDGCKLSNCALVGGETSEMPGMYEGDNHYDTNGTAVGAVKKNKMLPKINKMCAGDVILGLGSDGLHSNGFSLVRKIIEVTKLDLQAPAPWESSKDITVADSCLVPTKIYVKSLLTMLKQFNNDEVLGLAHITGGGLVENIPRCLPDHLSAKIEFNSWKIPTIFKWFGKNGNVPVSDFFKTFNAGIGMIIIIDKVTASDSDKLNNIIRLLEKEGETVHRIGELVEKANGQPGCFINGVVEEGFYSC